MPQLDASLIGGYQPIQPPDPLNQLTKYLQIQHMQQAQQSGALQLQQAQQSAQETNALRQYLSDPVNQGQDANTMRAGIQRVAPIAGQPILKNMLDTQKTQGEIQGTQLGNADKGRMAVASLAGALSQKPDLNPNDMQRFVQEAAKLGVQLDPAELATATDPNAAREALLRIRAKGMTAEQQVNQTNPTILPTEQGIAAVSKDGSSGRMVPNVSGAATYQNGMPGVGPGIAPAQQAGPQTTPVGFPTVSPQMQMSRDGDRLRILQDELSRETNPDARAALQSEIARTSSTQAAGRPFGGQQVSQVQATPATLGAKPSGTWEVDPTTGQRVYAPKFANPGDTLNPGGNVTLSTQDKLLAKQIANYDMAPMTSMALHNPHNAAIMAEAVNQNPSFDSTQYAAKANALKAFSTGQQGNSLRSFAVATDHLDTLQQLVGALKNSDYPLINRLANTVSTQTGGTAPTNFDTAKDIVSKEVIKAIVGSGGGVSEREDLAKRMNNASAPAQLLQQIDYYKTLMGAQRDALVSQYENTTGRTDAATRFNFAKKSGGPKTAPPISQADIDALNSLYPAK